MLHRDAMAQRAEPDPRDPDPGCGAELGAPRRGFLDDVSWTVFDCPVCGVSIATVEGRRHWWNYVISPASAVRLGVASPA